MNINYKQIAQIILNIAFVSSIIGVLYFTYGKNVEKLIVQDQSEYIAQTMGSDIKMFFPADIRQSIVSNLTVPDMSKADAEAEETNAALEKKAAEVLGLLCIIGISLALIICWYGNVSKKHLFIEAGVILCFVVATEVSFLNIVGRNYKSADPNFVKCEILKSIKTEFPPSS
jgi:hypothetical protein